MDKTEAGEVNMDTKMLDGRVALVFGAVCVCALLAHVLFV